MKDVYPKRRFAVFLALPLATASMTSLTVAIKPQQAIAQSPMEMMEMMMGDGNMTNGSMMMDNNNMSRLTWVSWLCQRCALHPTNCLDH
jgi:hypothetical protein